MTDNNHAIANARAWADDIRLAMVALEVVRNGDCEPVEYDGETFAAEDELRQRIEEKPLSIQVRDGWRNPGGESVGAEEFEILLSTGGPALRIIGKLGDYCEVYGQPVLQWQDWGTPWTDHATDQSEDAAISEFCGLFYFGE